MGHFRAMYIMSTGSTEHHTLQIHKQRKLCAVVERASKVLFLGTYLEHERCFVVLLRHCVSLHPTSHDLCEKLMALQPLNNEPKGQRLATWQHVVPREQVLASDKLACHEAAKVFPVYLVPMHPIADDCGHHGCNGVLVTWYITCLHHVANKSAVVTQQW